MKGTTTRKMWGVQPETLAAIAKFAAGELSVEEIQAEHRAAGRRPQVTGGTAVIPLRGVITPRPSFLGLLFGGGGGLQSFRESLHEALTDDDVASVLIDVDSPGGLTDLVPETAAEIRAARGQKPIVAIANTCAASAAYWIAAQADELVVTPSGEVGSIGVFMAHEDWSKFDEELGVDTTLISAGKYKTEGNPYEPLSDEAREDWQQTVDELYGMFAADVAKGRGITAGKVKSGYGEGRMLTSGRALEAGMVDRVETFEATVQRLVKKPPKSRRASALGTHAKAIPSHDTDTVDESWDADAEVGKIADDAGASVLRRMYAWVDPDGDADAKASYKFPHHKVVDGEPGPANLAGVRNALSRLPQADIPDADRGGVERHLNKHLDDGKSSAVNPAPNSAQADEEARERLRRANEHLLPALS